MPLPRLEVGLVVRYEYQWGRRALRYENADRDHPACVVALFPEPDGKSMKVGYLPISHTPPGENDVGIELSHADKRVAGLDALPQWILVSECNTDRWAQGVRQIPRRPGVFQYGLLRPITYERVKTAFLELANERRVTWVHRR